MLLGALFLGIGGQASNIREIQTLSMPITLLQLMVLLLAMNAVGNEGAMVWTAYLVPFSSPMAMIAYGAQHEALWPHLLALVWQALWIVIIIRLSARMFRRTVLKSAPGGAFFSLGFWRGGRLNPPLVPLSLSRAFSFCAVGRREGFDSSARTERVEQD